MRLIKNIINLYRFLQDCHFEYKDHHIILEYEGSIIHLDNNGHLSIRPKGYLLNHCTLQEVLEQTELGEINHECCPS